MGYESPKPTRKPLEWIADSKEELSGFPLVVKEGMGHALHLAQISQKSLYAKVLRGFGGAGVLEILEDHDGNTYRAVYTVKFQGVVYVLHAFQKKSNKGIATPKPDIDLIKARLKAASDHYEAMRGSKKR